MKSQTLSLMSEKRQAPRMPVEWGLKLRVTGENEPMEGRTLNVSKGGLAISLDRALAADTVAKVVLRTGDDAPELHAYAYVAWAGIEADHPTAGLRFMGIDEADEERLAAMVESWMHSGARGRSRN